MSPYLVVCGVVLFSWPIAVIIWRYVNRERPQATRDAYRAPPPPAAPEPPWFVRWWDWANSAAIPTVWVKRWGGWFVGVLSGVAIAVITLTSVKFEKSTKAPEVSEAKADGKYPGWTCKGSGFWVPDGHVGSQAVVSLSCTADSYGAQNCVACDTATNNIRCWRLERCP